MMSWFPAADRTCDVFTRRLRLWKSNYHETKYGHFAHK